MVLVDPHSESQASKPGPGGQPPADTASSLDRLLNAWGIEAPSDKVVLDLRGAWRVRANPGDRVQAVDYVAWYNLQGDSLNHDDVSLAQLDQITVASAGEVRKKDGRYDRVHPAADHLAADHAGGCRPRPAGTQPGPPAGRFPQREHPPRPRRPHPRRVGLRLPRRPACPGRRPGAPGRLPRTSAPQPGRGQYRRRQRHRYPGGPLLGPGAGFLRPAGGDAVQRQRPLPRQPGGYPVGLRRADLAALARREPAALRAGRGHPPQRRCRIPPDRTPADPEAGRDREAAARAAPGDADAATQAPSATRTRPSSPRSSGPRSTGRGRRSSPPAASSAPCSWSCAATSRGWRPCCGW